jgi:hypothetical protein
MKRLVVLISATLFCCDLCSAGVSVVKNGSFENNGYMEVSPTLIPQYWCSVNYNTGDFAGFLADRDNYWATDGIYSLAFNNLSKSTVSTRTATISQSVYLTAADQIMFDTYLFATNGNWTPAKATAKVLIDGNTVWDSNGLTYPNGEFTGHIVIDINQVYKDEYTHILSFQLALNTSSVGFIQYYALWDSIGFNSVCGMNGYAKADLNHDCVVDINDLAVFAEGWLSPNGPDLNNDGNVDFIDFAVVGRSWGNDTRGAAFLPKKDFVFLSGDLDDNGIVDFVDFSILANNWFGQGGSCVRYDLNKDGIVDLRDLSLLAGQWLQIGGLYGM